MTWKGCKVLKPKKGWQGARAGIIDATYLARRVWPKASYGNAFAYLFRRFGETAPFDWHKELCNYNLTTPDPEVGFWLKCSPGSSGLQPGYWLSGRLADAILENEYIDHLDWPPVYPELGIYGGNAPPEGTLSRRAHDAIEAGMRDLLRPVFIRDMPITILGPASNKDCKLPIAEHAWQG
jgi:hypothetical protein